MSIREKTKYPDIRRLSDIDHVKSSFVDLMNIIDKEENQLHNDTPFPFGDLNYIGSLSFAECVCYDNDTIAEMIWTIDEVVRRIEIQEGRNQKILNWLEGKLAKAIALIPPENLAYMDRDIKYQTLAVHYPVVRYLLDERDDYVRQQVHWKNLAKNMEKKSRSLWYVLEKQSKQQ